MLLPLALLGAGAFLTPAAVRGQEFLRGDLNSDGRLSTSDYLMLRRFLFSGELPPSCGDTGDADDSGRLDITDGIFLLNRLFLGGPPLPAPYPEAGSDLTPDDLDCASYDVSAPATSADLLRVGDAEGAPGSTVSIPVYVTAVKGEIEAFQLVLSYDQSFFTADRRLFFDGSFYEEAQSQGLLESFRVATDQIAPGMLVVSFIPHLSEDGFELPPGPETLVFNLSGTISETATPGTVVDLEPVVETGAGPHDLRNELTRQGEASFFSTIPQTEGGVLRIVIDQTFFRRGDADASGAVNITDAEYTLNYLFLGGPAPSCLDAADADDSGDLNITDPIHTLTFLFLGGSTMPPPYSEPGDDPSPDDLDCVSS
jgi:hypothetical protein